MLKTIANFLYRLEIKGFDKLHFDEPTILMPNHTSLLDAVFLTLNLPKEVTFVVNTSIAKRYGRLLKGRNFITINPLNPYSIREMMRVVKKGMPLCLFPEGRITRTGGLMKIYHGITFIAMRTNAKIYPISINGPERSKLSYLNHVNRTRWFPKCTISIGDPVRLHIDPSLRTKAKKENSSKQVLHILREELFQSRMKPSVNLYNELVDASKKFGKKKTAMEDLSGTTSYQQMIVKINVLSQVLKRLIPENKTRVGLLLPTSATHAVVLFSLFKLGKTPAILNFSTGAKTLRDACETAELKIVFTSREFITKGKLEETIQGLSPDVTIHYLEDCAKTIHGKEKILGGLDAFLRRKTQEKNQEVVLFTSGSEAKPKGVVLSHENLYANIQQARTIVDFTEKDKMFNALPMFHSFGLITGTILPLLCGMEVFLYPSPLHAKNIVELVYDRRATILFGTSTFLEKYAKQAHDYDFFSLRYVFAGAEKLKEEVQQLWLERFGIRIFEGYGITECSPILSLNSPLTHKKGSVGQLLPGIEHRIEPVEGVSEGGVLWVKGPNVMKGYLLHQKGFIPKEEWYNTGDVVAIDEDGYLHIQSRLKRFAKIAGEMIPLNLVEEIASACFQTTELACVAVSDDRRGESLVLLVTNSEWNRSTLRDFLIEKEYSSLYLPSKFVMVPNIPLLGSGKTDYVTCKELANFSPENQKM